MVNIIVVMVVFSIYFYHSFIKYSEAAYIAMSNLDNSTKQVHISSLNTPYGFLEYKEFLLFNVLDVNNIKLQEKIDLGYRVTMVYPNSYFLMKQALLLGLKKDNENSLKFIKAACLFDFSRNCQNIFEQLVYAQKEYPEYFTEILNNFILWLGSSPDNKGVTIGTQEFKSLDNKLEKE